MIRWCKGWTRRFLLSLVGLWAVLPTFAQDASEGVASEESSGNPIYGYVATAFLCGLILFIVGRSSRR